jgi:hypothetical protein
MAMDTNEASARYARGIDPYTSRNAYEEAAQADSSQEAQDIFLEIKEEEYTKESLVDKFEAGYSRDSGMGGTSRGRR